MNVVAGRMTSANSAVSVRKMSWTARNSSALSALRTLLMFGSDRNGFSPIMYMPRTPPVSADATLSDRRLVNRLIVGIEHRDQARVGRPLHVVLPAQRVQPAARPADVAGDRAQRDQAAGVVCAGGVLRDPHAPVHDGRVRLSPDLRDIAQHGRRDPADLSCALGRVLL